MKKVAMVIGMMLFVLTSNAQIVYDTWETSETVDEFGDKTGAKVERLFCKGTFNNSATTGSELIVKLVDYGDGLFLDLYEYGSPPGARIVRKTTPGFIQVKRADGAIEEYKTYAFDNGGLFFSKKDYKKISELITNGKGEELKVLIKDSFFNSSSSSQYVFTMITKSFN